MISDPIGDMLIRIKNAYLARHKSLEFPYSSLKENLAKILMQEGFLGGLSVTGRSPGQKSLQLELKYKGKKATMSGLREISKPGLRVYVPAREIPLSRRGSSGLVILSTPRGLMTGGEAKKKNLGGELLCEVW